MPTSNQPITVPEMHERVLEKVQSHRAELRKENENFTFNLRKKIHIKG